MSHTDGIGSPQNPFAPGTTASSGPGCTERAGSDSISGASQSGAAGAAPVDDAKLSSTASVLSQALTHRDVRMDKVSSLQETIAAGTYSIPASDVASKIISSLLS